MPDNKDLFLSDIVRISPYYQRSIRVDIDMGRKDALDGYICHQTAHAVLASMSKQIKGSNQRAFTWTGPFGGGKSSLAIALGSALSPNKALRAKAREILKAADINDFDKALPVKRGWLVIPLVGKRTSIASELSKAVQKATGKVAESRKINTTSLINEICIAADDKSHDGVLLIIDEMGKYLEASALGSGDDVYFFQELAEAAARCSGRLVIVGILHQSFNQYASKLGINTKDDWAKVQGRYSDIPLVAASDEVVELVGKAIEADKRPEWMAKVSKVIGQSIQSQRPAVGEAFSDKLFSCWPLHPGMAALLGPISRRQFGQSERSTFAFLASVEPHGFSSYLNSTLLTKATWYRPDNYWDYLRANLDQAILASPDGHRWAQAVEAVERTEAKSDDPLHIALIKNIAIIDVFRSGSGLTADLNVLTALLYDESKSKIELALNQLALWRVAIFKKHIGSWSIFEGSDFDIDAAVNEACATLSGVDFELLSKLTNLYPIIAKRHYHETGTMRWMSMSICRLHDIKKIAENFTPQNGEFGLFLLALPEKGSNPKVYKKLCLENSRLEPWPIAIGIPKNYAKIEELGTELLALQIVQSRHELGGDPVARREVQARISSTQTLLEDQLRAAVVKASWIVGEQEILSGIHLSPIASDLADNIFKNCPAIWSELVNRESLSSNIVKARRELLYRMLDHEQEPNLGIEGFPAERGLYETLLKSTGLHRLDQSGVWRFQEPNEKFGSTFFKLWNATKSLFSDSSKRISTIEIHELWSSPPFGLRAGLMPVVLTAFLLAHKSNIAVYKDGIFIPHISEADIDEYLQDARRFSMRWILIDEEKENILLGIAQILEEVGESSGARDPIEAARSLVALVFGLPAWSQRTQCLSNEARLVRDTLLKASDPHKVLFIDLAAILENSNGISYVDALRAPIKEISSAYQDLLRKIEATMLEALDAPPDRLDRLRIRAESVAAVTGDLRQDAFAARLAKYDGSKASIEGILSLAANKPPRDWNDRDIDLALLEIAQVALRFRQTEAFVSVKGRKPTTEAFAVVIGAGKNTKFVSRSFSISDRHRDAVDTLASELTTKLTSAGLSTDVLLAALAKVGMKLTDSESTLTEK